MPLLRINATATGLNLHETPRPAARELSALASCPGPAIIMVHGYKYAPGTADHCPHRKIFSDRVNGWPAQLGFGHGLDGEGLGIALGWYARGSLKAVHRRAAELGESLAIIVAMLRKHAPRRPVHVIAHSLGSEAALHALRHLPAGAIDRMVLLTGASYTGSARRLLDTPAGRSLDLLNITSRENDVFDAAFEHLVRAEVPRDRAIGQGVDAPNVANIQLDCPRTLKGLSTLGFDVASAERRICHWSSYRRSGVMALYRTFLRSPDTLPLDGLIRNLPSETAPRWSRLLTMPRVPLPARQIFLPLRPHRVGSAQRPGGAALTRRPKNEPAY